MSYLPQPLKREVGFVADYILSFIIIIFQRKCLDNSCELSAWRNFHMECHDLFSLKEKQTKPKNYRPLQL